MAALARPAVHTLGGAAIIPSCRAASCAWLATGTLPEVVLQSPNCAVGIFDRREKDGTRA